MRETDPPLTETVGYLCVDCGELILGDVLTFLDRARDAMPAPRPRRRQIERS